MNLCEMEQRKEKRVPGSETDVVLACEVEYGFGLDTEDEFEFEFDSENETDSGPENKQ